MGSVYGSPRSGAKNSIIRALVTKYTVPMPSRVYVHLKDVSKPSVVKDGFSVETNKETNQLVVKSATDETLGMFLSTAVVGWWIEREPLNLKDMSAEELTRFMAAAVKCGIVDEQ